MGDLAFTLSKSGSHWSREVTWSNVWLRKLTLLGETGLQQYMNGNRVNGEEVTSSVIQVGVYGGLY